MADTQIGALERIQQNLTANPPKTEEALKELENVLKSSSNDPRVNLYQALALSLSGDKKGAKQYAELAQKMARDIEREAGALISKLG